MKGVADEKKGKRYVCRNVCMSVERVEDGLGAESVCVWGG